MNYAEREHAKVLRDEVTEDPFFMGSVNQAFHIFHTICIGRDLLPKATKRVALDSLARLVANANTTAKSTGGAALLVPIRRCAAQLWHLCVAVRSTQGGSRPSGTDATRSDDG